MGITHKIKGNTKQENTSASYLLCIIQCRAFIINSPSIIKGLSASNGAQRFLHNDPPSPLNPTHSG